MSRTHRYRLPTGASVWCPGRLECAFLFDEIFTREAYRVPGPPLPEKPTVLDVGAHVGLFSMWTRELRPEARILAFEPVPSTFRCLTRNARMHFPGARLFNCALGAEPGTARLRHYARAAGWSGRRPDETLLREALHLYVARADLSPGQRALKWLSHRWPRLGRRLIDDIVTAILRSGTLLECPVRTISEVLFDAKIDRIDLLKVDVEGDEGEVLVGVADADWRRIDRVTAEVQRGAATIEAALRERGFRVASAADPALRGTPFRLLRAWRE